MILLFWGINDVILMLYWHPVQIISNSDGSNTSFKFSLENLRLNSYPSDVFRFIFHSVYFDNSFGVYRSVELCFKKSKQRDFTHLKNENWNWNKCEISFFQRQPNRTIRLVDGPNVNEGIVQLLELERWQSVCTNSRNWTQADLEVACRQLGFQGGEWVFWYPHLNDTNQILYQDPGKNFVFVKLWEL